MHNYTLEHIGIIVSDMENAAGLFEMLGYTAMGGVIEDYIQNNYLRFFSVLQNAKIELIRPMNSKSTVYGAKVGYHHLCYRVEYDREVELEIIRKELRQQFHVRPITGMIAAPAFAMKDIQFFCGPNGVVLELLFDCKER